MINISKNIVYFLNYLYKITNAVAKKDAHGITF